MAFRSVGGLRPKQLAFQHRQSPSPLRSTPGMCAVAAPAQGLAVQPTQPSSALLFQLEIDGRDALRPMTPPPPRDLHNTLIRLDSLMPPETSFEARLARDARYYHAAIVEEEGHADVVILASRLAGVGYCVTMRTALGGGSGVSAFKHLSHEFLVVAGPPDGYHFGSTAEYIVDPRFREQFDIPQTVDWYDEVLVSVPETYVGPPSRLRSVVRLLGSEMAAAFTSAGAVTPPWRSPSSLLSKWLPARSRDQLVGDGPASPHASPSSSFPRRRKPTFAASGAELRTTSAPGIVSAPDGDSSTSRGPPPGLPTVPPDMRSDSEEERLSSPDTILVWGFQSAGSRRRSEKHVEVQPTGTQAAAAEPQLHGIPRTISREQLALGSGGRSPPHAAAAGVPPGAPSLRPIDQAAASPHYAAHPQAPPPRRKSAPDFGRPPLDPGTAAQLPLHRASTSALSSKLASAGLSGLPKLAATEPAAAAASPGAKLPLRRGDSADTVQPLQLRGGTGTLPAGARLQGDSPLPLPPSDGQSKEPSVHAPFWDQPLIMDYIAAQHPATAGGTLHGSSRSGLRAPQGSAVAAKQPFGGVPAAAARGDGCNPGEPRIRTVKMRGAGAASGFHAAPRVRAH